MFGQARGFAASVHLGRIERGEGGFGGGLLTGSDVGASGRFAANNAGEATSAAGTGQFVFDTDDPLLLWDDGAGAAAAVGLARFDDSITLAATDLRVVA